MRSLQIPLLLVALLVSGCQSGLQRIDSEVDQLIAQTDELVQRDLEHDHTPTVSGSFDSTAWGRDVARTNPDTVNPSADQLEFTTRNEEAGDDDAEANAVLERLQLYGTLPKQASTLDLGRALSYAKQKAPDYRDAEEDYVLAALDLMAERHLWGPRLFDDISATVEGDAIDGTYDTSLRLVNELRATQRLPYGGEVSARLIARATEDLRLRVSDEKVQSAEVILGMNVPLLRGAGLIARESLIQFERNLIYAARSFERFRRVFLFDVSSDFLDLVVRQRNIENAERQVRSFEELEAREEALVEAGRQTPFQAARAAQDTLEARDRLIDQRESYILAVDRFKVLIGMPSEQALIIDASSLELPVPDVSLADAVSAAMEYRLDLQNRRDQLDDFRRDVDNARNGLLPDLDLDASVSIPTEDERGRAGLHFDDDEVDFSAGLRMSLPLDRKIEKIDVRDSEIRLRRAIRSYNEFRDTIAVNVRSAVRDIDRAIFSLRLREEDIRIAELREASIQAAPDRATTRDRSEAVDALLRAKDDYDRARRDLQVAILRLLLDTGQLRVEQDGTLRPISGMKVRDQADLRIHEDRLKHVPNGQNDPKTAFSGKSARTTTGRALR